MADLLTLARAVKRGAAFLDQRIPSWRKVLRQHEAEFDFAKGSHCILRTLEHHVGLRTLRRLRDKVRLTPKGHVEGFPPALGFDAETGRNPYEADLPVLAALWRAEFEK